MVGIEHLARAREVDLVFRQLAPRERRDPVEVRADDAVLGGRGRQALEAGELAPCCFLDFLGQLERVDPAAQLFELGLLGITLAELFVDRLHLLAQEELALALLELRLHLRLDLRAELGDLELTVEDPRYLAQALLDVDELEQLLLLVGLQAQGRRDERAQRARVVDVCRRELQLLREVRDEPDDAAEGVLDVARERLELFRLDDAIGQLDELADQVGVVVDAALEFDASQPLHEDAQRPIGNADHLVHHCCRAELIEVIPLRRLRVLVAHRDQREQTVAADDVVDELDRPLLPDRERRHRVREDDRLLERQHRQRRRQLVAELLRALLLLRTDDDELLVVHPRTSITIFVCSAPFSASGSRTRSRPCS